MAYLEHFIRNFLLELEYLSFLFLSFSSFRLQVNLKIEENLLPLKFMVELFLLHHMLYCVRVCAMLKLVSRVVKFPHEHAC